MKLLQVTLWMYSQALQKSWECVRKNWIVSLAPVAYSIGLSIIATLVAPLGIIGGFINGLASAACASSGLFLIKNMVESGKTDVNDFLNGFTAYIWDIVTVSFILWIPFWALGSALMGVPNGALIFFLIKIAVYVLLNAVPELIYQSRTSGLELIGASYNFIVENWIEWLIPNLLLAFIGYWLLGQFASLLYSLPWFVELLLSSLAMGLLLTYFMTFRGFLFSQLHGTTRRTRIYRYDARA